MELNTQFPRELAVRDERHAVVVLHGLCGSPLEMGSIPKSLERSGFVVSHLEIPGYTAQWVKRGESVDWQDWCDIIDAEVSRLSNQYASVSLCGLSMGATLALATAIRRKDILAVVALSPIFRYDGWAIPWYAPILQMPYWLGLRNWSYKESEPYGLKNVEMRRRVKKSLEAEGISEVGAAAIPARQLDAAKKLMASVRKNLGQITAKLLVMHAIDDESAAPRNAEIIIRQVNSEVRKIIWLGDCYHIITFDNEREIVTNESVRFLRKSTQALDSDLTHRQTAKRAALKDRR